MRSLQLAPAAERQGHHRLDRPHGESLLAQTPFKGVDFERRFPLIIGRHKIEGALHALEIGILFRPHIHGIFRQPGGS